ncbi:hypothetical protein KP509_1Z277500 [Ceratopteris richardii]|nr:hypothetical protein KP509_1Z277500 [Ceratopteris richardii]
MQVQIVKCLVDDVVVDISFNQLGGICTLCFLEEVLCKFLQFFSQFDWKRYCISLLGPICLTDLHGVNMELPNTDPSTLLFNHDFISTCRHVYGVPFQGTQNLRFKNFSSKNMNIIDPLRLDNNLGRSVNKGNFFRICSALAYGAKQTERILHRSLEDIPEILHDFFRNTKKHCDQCHLDGFTFRIGNMSSQSSSCLPGYSEDKCEMNLSVVESFCEDASKTMNETKNSTSVMGDMTLRCKPEDISGLSSCGAGYHGESTYPSDGIAHQDRYFKSLRESSVSSGCDNKLSEYMESSGESSTLVSGGCGSSCGEADRSVPNEGKYVSMPLLNIQADDHSALHVNNVNGYSILTGDYGAFLLNLHTCRWMVAAQIHKPINFPPYIMYTGQCLLDHYASGGPTNAIFGSMHLVTQAFMQNYEQYLNQPFQALSLQSRSTMLSNRMQQREVYNSYRGTGTYLPTCRPSRYRDLQSMHNGKTRSNSSRLSNWRGIGNQHGSNGFNSRSSHDDMYVNFHSNKQSGYRTRHLYPVEESSNFPTIGVGSEGFNKNPTPRESGSVEGEVTMPREKALQKGSMLTSALPSGSSSSRHGNGFTKEYTEFGSFFIPNYARKTEREVAYDDLRRYPEGLRFQNSLYSMSRNNIDTEVDAKITHNNQG